MITMYPVVHFERICENKERLAKFYYQVIDWQMHHFSKGMADYVVSITIETDENRVPLNKGAIGEGFFPKIPEMSQYPFIVIVVEDITMAMKKIADTGGEVHGYPVEIPCIGRYVAITDSEGNRVGVLEPITL